MCQPVLSDGSSGKKKTGIFLLPFKLSVRDYCFCFPLNFQFVTDQYFS